MSDEDVDPQRERAAIGGDLIIPILAAAFTVYFLVDSADLVWEARANGTVIGVVLLGLIAVQVARMASALRAGRATLSLGPFAALDEAQRKRIALLIVLVVFVATIHWLGTTLGVFLTMLAAMWALGYRDLGRSTLIAAVTAGTVYLLFIALLQTRLPAGPVERLLAPLFGS
jgi:hypothetical protein